MDTLEVNDFASGWLKAATISGRPVDVIVADDGSLFVSDDNAGKIYRIHYAG
jgi:glucose/arabinose dehydrogenase